MSTSPQFVVQYPDLKTLADPQLRDMWARDVVQQLSQHHESIDRVNAALTDLAQKKATPSAAAATPAAPSTTIVQQASGATSSSFAINQQVGTSYALQNGDNNKFVTCSNAAPIAVSIAPAGVNYQFLIGWFCFLLNLGAGAITLTPDTSTVNGAATLVIPGSSGIVLISDGTNYVASWFGLGNTSTGTVTNASNLADANPVVGDGGTHGIKTVAQLPWAKVDKTGAAASDVGAMPSAYLDTDGTLAANSNSKVPSQAAIVTFVAAHVTGPLNIDCGSSGPISSAVFKFDLGGAS